MIEVKELRVGNIINGVYYDPADETETEKYQQCMVLGVDSTNFAEYSILVDSKSDVEEFEYFDPIPLTEDWLVKFGFKVRGLFMNHGKLDIIQAGIRHYPKGRTYFNSWTIREAQPEYVHQLQNLFFALTGEELKITEI